MAATGNGGRLRWWWLPATVAATTIGSTWAAAWDGRRGVPLGPVEDERGVRVELAAWSTTAPRMAMVSGRVQHESALHVIEDHNGPGTSPLEVSAACSVPHC